MKTFPTLKVLLVLVLIFLLLIPAGQQTAGAQVDHEFEHILVDTTEDTVDALADDWCADEAGNCSLRAAVQCANLWPGEQTIELGEATYLLSLPGANEDAAASGDLDLGDTLVITGAGPELTVIDGGGIDRVLEVLPAAVVQVSGLALVNGQAPSTTGFSYGRDGGGILNHAALTLENAWVSGNQAGGASDSTVEIGGGGGIFNDGGTLVLNQVEITGNETANGVYGTYRGSDGGHGAGLSSLGGTVVLTDSQVTGNRTGDGGDGGTGLNSFGGNGGAGGGIYLSSGGVISATRSVVAQNLTGAGGYGNRYPDGYGGSGGPGAGIYVGEGGLTLVDSSVEQNTSGDGGSGCGDISSPVGCTAGFGAGIAVVGSAQNASLELSNTVVQGNLVGLPGSLTVKGADGGGVYCNDASLNLAGATLEANLAGDGGAGANYGGRGGRGGGLFAWNCPTQISGSSVRNNLAGDGALAVNSGEGGYGGGAFIGGSIKLNMSDTSVADNLAGNGGGTAKGGSGGGLALSLSATLSGVTIHGNRAGADSSGSAGWGYGGGVHTTQALTLLNSTLSGNTAGYGGGIYSQATLNLQSDTITLNAAVEAAGQWGGVAGIGSTYGRNTIIANNSAPTNPDCFALISQGYNLIGNPACTISGDLTGNLTGVEARLGALQDNGGPVFTHLPEADSPAIDAANPAIPGSGGNACPALDQRGRLRQILACDIGTVELQIEDVSGPIVRWLATGIPASFGPGLAIATLTEGDEFSLAVLRSTTAPEGIPAPELDLELFWELSQVEEPQFSSPNASARPAGFSMELTLCYLEDELAASVEEDLLLLRWDGEQWVSVSTERDTVRNCLWTRDVTTLSVWSVGVAERIYLPLVVR